MIGKNLHNMPVQHFQTQNEVSQKSLKKLPKFEHLIFKNRTSPFFPSHRRTIVKFDLLLIVQPMKTQLCTYLVEIAELCCHWLKAETNRETFGFDPLLITVLFQIRT